MDVEDSGCPDDPVSGVDTDASLRRHGCQRQCERRALSHARQETGAVIRGMSHAIIQFVRSAIIDVGVVAFGLIRFTTGHLHFFMPHGEHAHHAHHGHTSHQESNGQETGPAEHIHDADHSCNTGLSGAASLRFRAGVRDPHRNLA